MKPGIYENIPFSEYLQIDAFSHSLVSECLKSPKALKWHMENERKQTKAMAGGSLIDTMLFEPNEFSKRFIVHPDTCTTKDGKVKPWDTKTTEAKEFLSAIPSGISCISSADVSEAAKIITEIKYHPTAWEWLKTSVYQVTIIWIDPETKELCKGRADATRDNLGVTHIIDLKRTETPYPSAFSRICNSFGYHVQGAMYSAGYVCALNGEYPIDKDTNGILWQIPFSIIAAGSSDPYEVICYNMGLESLDVGFEKFKKAIQVYHEAKINGEWPGYSAVAEDLEIPAWAKNALMLEGKYD